MIVAIDSLTVYGLMRSASMIYVVFCLYKTIACTINNRVIMVGLGKYQVILLAVMIGAGRHDRYMPSYAEDINTGGV